MSRRLTSHVQGRDLSVHCDICLEEKSVEAEAYCIVCKQYLCSTCTTAHQRVSGTKSHKLLIGDALSEAAASYSRAIESGSAPVEHSKCLEHRGEDVEYFCESHDVPCCEKCKRIEHRNCALESISDVAKKQEVGVANTTTIKTAKDILDEIKAFVQENEHDLEMFTGEKNGIVDAIKSQRKKIDKAVDQWEHHLLQVVDKSFKAKSKQTNDHNSVFSDMMSSLKGKVTKLNTAVESADEEAVVIASATRKDIKKYKDTLSEIPREKIAVKMKLNTNEPSRKFIDCLHRDAQLIVSEQISGHSPEQVFPDVLLTGNRMYKDRVMVEDGGIYVESSSDTVIPSITGIEILQDGRMIMCDPFNWKLKLFDANCNFLCEREFSCRPWRICLTSVFGEVVITTPDENSLQFVNIDSQGAIVEGRKIKLDFSALGFCLHQVGDNFILNRTTESDTLVFQIVDRNGQRVNTIVIKNLPASFLKGRYIFTSMNVSQTVLYVARDIGGCLGISLNTSELVFHYKDTRADREFGYTGVTTDPDGNVYIAGSKTGDIVRIDEKGQKFGVPVTGVHGIRFIKFISSRNTLYTKLDGICFVKTYRLL